ncbi:MAG: hypothetical protein ACSHW7_11800 [Patiriisocius sp.]
MQHFSSVLSLQESKDLIQRFKKHFQEFNYTYFAVEILDTNEFIGLRD